MFFQTIIVYNCGKIAIFTKRSHFTCVLHNSFTLLTVDRLKNKSHDLPINNHTTYNKIVIDIKEKLRENIRSQITDFKTICLLLCLYALYAKHIYGLKICFNLNTLCFI